MRKLLVCTFSGGRTSAFMGQFLNTYDKYKDYDKVFVFANTGKEKEETLEFIDKCDKEWNLNVVWLEADVQKEKGIGTTYKIVDFETASRNGEPFEAMLKKYPKPNTFVSNCTRELKLAPINKYVKSLCYDEVYTAMGIRYDERHRVSNTAKEQNLIYPLVDDIQVDNKFIRNWWDKQPFDLQLKDYEGNCDLCFKKSLKKRLTILKENPNVAEWWIKMENKYKETYIEVEKEFDYVENDGVTEQIIVDEKEVEKTRYFDTRTNLSVKQQLKLSKQQFTTAQDIHELDKQQCNLFEFETDCFCKAN